MFLRGEPTVELGDPGFLSLLVFIMIGPGALFLNFKFGFLPLIQKIRISGLDSQDHIRLIQKHPGGVITDPDGSLSGDVNELLLQDLFGFLQIRDAFRKGIRLGQDPQRQKKEKRQKAFHWQDLLDTPCCHGDASFRPPANQFLMKSLLTKRLNRLNRDLAGLEFTSPVHTVVNPWDYAKDGRDAYLDMLPDRPRLFLLGMNPGPWGMAQTGIPFGEVGMVRDWMGLTPKVKVPENEHSKRPVQGMNCTRSEVSGSRFWGWMKDRYGTPEACFREVVVWPFCPQMWLKESGTNLPPNQIRVAERGPMEKVCDDALDDILSMWQPEHLIAIGQYAEVALHRIRPETPVTRILHPSPASPAANKDWAGTVTRQLSGIL